MEVYVSHIETQRAKLVFILKFLYKQRGDQSITIRCDDQLLVIYANWPEAYWKCYNGKRGEVRNLDLLEAIRLEAEKKNIRLTWVGNIVSGFALQTIREFYR